MRDYKTAHIVVSITLDGKCVFPKRLSQIASRPQSHDCSLWVTNIPLSHQNISGCINYGAKRKRAFQRKHEEKTVSSLCWPSTSMHGQTTISDSIVLLRWARPPIRPQDCVCLCILFFVFVYFSCVFASYQVYVCVFFFAFVFFCLVMPRWCHQQNIASIY